MTLGMFDPICFGQYPKGKEPDVLHFQYEGQEDVFRYVMVERIPINEINITTRRKAGEKGTSGETIRDKYLKLPDTKPTQPEIVQEPPKPEPPVKKKAKKRSK